jgi:hypothetical protein
METHKGMPEFTVVDVSRLIADGEVCIRGQETVPARIKGSRA